MTMFEALGGLFSDRGRERKAGACLALTALLASLFQAQAAHQDLGFLQLARMPHPGIAHGEVVGPEHFQVVSLGAEGIQGRKFGETIELLFPEGGSGDPLRGQTAEVHLGAHVVVTAHHLGGPRFELVSLRTNPYRVLKLVVSGLAALAALGAFPFFFRWEKGSFRPRGGEAAVRA